MALSVFPDSLLLPRPGARRHRRAEAGRGAGTGDQLPRRRGLGGLRDLRAAAGLQGAHGGPHHRHGGQRRHDDHERLRQGAGLPGGPVHDPPAGGARRLGEQRRSEGASELP